MPLVQTGIPLVLWLYFIIEKLDRGGFQIIVLAAANAE